MSSEDKYKELSKPDVIKYINENLKTPIPKLILKGIPFKSIEKDLIINQITGKNKARKKLPTWYKNEKIIYPPILNLEQTSSEITAHHKSKFISGRSMIDLTGGFGVDDVYFSKRVDILHYIEKNNELAEIARFNFKALDCNNIEVYKQDSIKKLEADQQTYEWIYVDPARRNKNEKVFLVKDSLPNILEHQTLLKEKSKFLMIKTSPMYDIEMGYKELSGVKELHVMSVKNEVKELLWIIDWRKKNTRDIKLFNYDSKKIFSYSEVNKTENNTQEIELSPILKYIYEFNSSIMKSGCYDLLGDSYKLKKIETNTHLYTSDLYINDFPGKIYLNEEVENINFKKLKKRYSGAYINLIAKNIQLSTKMILQKLNCNIGGQTDYLIFIKTIDGNKMIKAQRIL
ncbi:RsmD family RNA methyltransferase [Psychroflexus tropicus]|uniref:RsmD family RNA methyltransferase n=1 Tax=Psychroflexus tropicus TaxID=197345 RepID=UPI0003694F56|nr:RsmD family RNA methyltransferase [Psychroflexus tropicus]